MKIKSKKFVLLVSIVVILSIFVIYLTQEGNFVGQTVYTIRGDLVVRTLGTMSIGVSYSNPPCGKMYLTLDGLPSGYVEGDSVVITGTISDSTLHVITIHR